MTVHLKCDPQQPDEEVIGQVVRILRDGGIVAFPTETFYGLGADARNEEAVEKIFRIKGRTARNPLSVIIGDDREVNLLIEAVPMAAQILMQRFWPGPLTIVFQAAPSLSRRLTAGTGKIGIRISSHPIAQLVAKRLAGPLTATSANPSGGVECSTTEEVIAAFGDRLDAVIDGGRTRGGLGSTIIDVTLSPPRILREGAIPQRDIVSIAGIR
jgi:L-threonylcarbamoyladenylate synthase